MVNHYFLSQCLVVMINMYEYSYSITTTEGLLKYPSLLQRSKWRKNIQQLQEEKKVTSAMEDKVLAYKQHLFVILIHVCNILHPV